MWAMEFASRFAPFEAEAIRRTLKCKNIRSKVFEVQQENHWKR
jgi:hypothetical protein